MDLENDNNASTFADTNQGKETGTKVLNSEDFITFAYGDDIVLHAISIDGEPWFVANDVCNALGYNNPWKATGDHCKHLTKREVFTTTGSKATNFINEPDMYRLVMRSKLAGAERFADWVFEEVLPSIRKTGAYKRASITSSSPKTDAGTGRGIKCLNYSEFYRAVFKTTEIHAAKINGICWFNIRDIFESLDYANPASYAKKAFDGSGELKTWTHVLDENSAPMTKLQMIAELDIIKYLRYRCKHKHAYGLRCVIFDMASDMRNMPDTPEHAISENYKPDEQRKPAMIPEFVSDHEKCLKARTSDELFTIPRVKDYINAHRIGGNKTNITKQYTALVELGYAYKDRQGYHPTKWAEEMGYAVNAERTRVTCENHITGKTSVVINSELTLTPAGLAEYLTDYKHRMTLAHLGITGIIDADTIQQKLIEAPSSRTRKQNTAIIEVD